MELKTAIIQRQSNGSMLFSLFAIGNLLLIAATWPLWTPQVVFPQVPLLSIAGTLPRPAEWLLLAMVLCALGTLLLVGESQLRRWACLVVFASTAGLVLVDQHRLQPWTWQFMIVSFVLGTADPTAARRIWGAVVIGIYAWSACSKLDRSFCFQHGPFLWDGIFRAIGFSHLSQTTPGGLRLTLAGLIPVYEMLIAIGLCARRTRRLAVLGAMGMHFGLLLALGPLGHNHRPGVLVWNLFFLVQNWMLFWREPSADLPTSAEPLGRWNRIGNRAAWISVAAVLVWPVLEPFGLCDHWPAWAVYAAHPERVTVYVSKEEIHRLPDQLKRFSAVQPFPDDWIPFRIDRWSLDTLYAPIYPQDRFQVGVALGLAEDFDLKQLRIVVEGPANRWSGNRSVREYEGLDSIRQLADSYRFNARPRLFNGDAQ